jgi:hypothetical protein
MNKEPAPKFTKRASFHEKLETPFKFQTLDSIMVSMSERSCFYRFKVVVSSRKKGDDIGMGERDERDASLKQEDRRDL